MKIDSLKLRGRHMAAAFASIAFGAVTLAASVPVNNPVADHYGSGHYPLWTDDVRWDNVIDMSTYGNGATNFERFENARDELHAQGGGVLYYPAGEYEFELPDMGFGAGIGPKSRGLMLKSGVVIRGADLAPEANQAVVRASEVHTESGFFNVTYNLAPQTVFVFQTQTRGTDPVTDLPNSAGEVPRDWNFIGMVPGEGEEHVGEVQNIGVVNVKLDGGFVFWGFHTPRSATLDTGTWWGAGMWKDNWPLFAPEEDTWAKRVPDGTHYMDAIHGATNWHAPVYAGSGRLIFGVYSINGAPFDDMSVIDSGGEHDPDAFHSYRYTGRLTAHGTDIFIGNNVLAKPTKNFVHRMLQRWQHQNQARQPAVVLFDYSNHVGVDVNKSNFGGHQDDETVVGPDTGYHYPNTIVRDNWIFNRGNKGMDIAAQWLVLYNNHNERYHARRIFPVDYITNPQYYINQGLGAVPGLVQDGAGIDAGGISFEGWRWQQQTTASDFMSRGYDIGGRNVHVERNSVINTGSIGNDGEGIMAQRHNNIETFSWAFIDNVQANRNLGPGTFGEPGWNGIYDMHAVGFLHWGNAGPGWSGVVLAASDNNWVLDTTVGPNLGTGSTNAPVVRGDGRAAVRYADYQAMHTDPVSAPTNLSATELPDARGIVIEWEDTADNELGFRVERRFADTGWHTIAYRPAQSMGAETNKTSPYTSSLFGAELNPPRWVDHTANADMGPDYRVVAFNANDDDSTGVSAFVGFGEEGPPVIFTDPVSRAVALGDSITLTVSAAGNPVPGYQWYFEGEAIDGATEAALELTDVTEAMLGDYYVVVSNALGSVTSETATLAQLFPPAAPSGLSAVPDIVSVELTWTDNSDNEDGFIIERWTTEGWITAHTVDADVTTATVSGLESGTTYQFRVRAFNAAGESEPSGMVEVSTMEGPGLYLINFSDDEYTMDPGGFVWQSFRLRQTAGSDSPKRDIDDALLQTVAGDDSAGIRFSAVSTVTNDVGYQSREVVQESFFVGNPFAWFTPSEGPQRDVFAFNQNGSGWTYTFSGFDPEDEVTFEFVIRRPNTGRNITLTFDPGGANEDARSFDSGVTQYAVFEVGEEARSDTYTFRLVSNTNNWVASINAMAISVQSAAPDHTPAQAWREHWFGMTGNEGDAADTADPDKDGVPNLLERAFGGNPLEPFSAALPVAERHEEEGEEYLTLTFVRLRGEAAAGLTYTVEAGTTLEAEEWNADPALFATETVDSSHEDYDIVTVRMAEPVSASGKQFMRLRVDGGE